MGYGMQTRREVAVALAVGLLATWLVLATGCAGEEPAVQEHAEELEQSLHTLLECQTDEDCDLAPPCRVGKCAGNQCRYVLSTPGCCVLNKDCQPYNPCLNGLCVAEEGEAEGLCQFPQDPLKPDCCNYPFECDLPPPGYVALCNEDEEAGYGKCAYIIDPESCYPPIQGLVINEFMANPEFAEDATGEWIELFNPNLDPIYLNGYSLLDADADDFTVISATPVVVPPGGYILLGRSDNKENNGKISPDYVYYNFTLSNGTDEIILVDPQGAEVDRVEYGPPEFSAVEGKSLALASPYMDNNAPMNWRSAQKNRPPTVDLGTPGEANTDGFFFYFTPVACNDNNSCTLDTCGKAGEATCTHESIQECCLYDVDCTDGNVCTDDVCKPETLLCLHNLTPGCCSVADECPQFSECLDVDCANHLCRYTQKPDRPGCCVQDTDCVDINPCTIDFCTQDPGTAWLTCHHKSPGGIQCCMLDPECNDGMTETVDVCLDNKCQHEPDPEFCIAPPPAYCDDGLPCTTDDCDLTTHLCVHTPTPDCCVEAQECDDQDPCTTDICQIAVHTCVHVPLSGCCHEDEDCKDFMSDQGLCKKPVCVASACRLQHLPDQNCCLTNFDCNDGDPCTDDLCNPGNNTCSHTSKGKGCCTAPADCASDEDPCTEPACVANQCVNAYQPGCCKGDWECEDANVCTDDRCLDYRCRFAVEPLSGCCTVDGECPATCSPCDKPVCADGHYCTVETVEDCYVVPNWAERFNCSQNLADMGWQTVNSAMGGFVVGSGGTGLGVDSCAVLKVNVQLMGGKSCLRSPRILVTHPEETITLSFEQQIEGDLAGYPVATELSVVGIPDGGAGEVKLALFDGTMVDPDSPYFLEVPAKLKSSPFGLEFCAKVPQGAPMIAWKIDSVKVGRGHPPRFLAFLEDLLLLPLQSVSLMLSAVDEDGAPAGFSVVGPEHITIEWLQPVDDTHTNLYLKVAPQTDQDLGVRKVSVEVGDGFFVDRRTFIETVYIPKCETDEECSDDNFCTTDKCDPVAGCTNAFIELCCNELTPCNDNDLCTEDVCEASACIFPPVVCDDSNPCTDNSCDPAVGCQHPFNSIPCQDNNVCTWHDTCYKGECLGLPLDCADGLSCTKDSCDQVDGCQHKSLCSDSILCTTDVCTLLGCKSGKVPVGSPPVDGTMEEDWPESSIQGTGTALIGPLRLLLDESGLYVAMQLAPQAGLGAAIFLDSDFTASTGPASMEEIASEGSGLESVLSAQLTVNFPGFGADLGAAILWGEDPTAGPIAGGCFSISGAGVIQEIPCQIAAGFEGEVEMSIPWALIYEQGSLEDRISALVLAATAPDGSVLEAVPMAQMGSVTDLVVFGVPDPLCLLSFCGDAIVDAGEGCDDGNDNSDFAPDACRTNCVPAHCGDDVVDDGEVCDDGELNSDQTPDACRTDCLEAHCGDGVTDAAEECDDGEFNNDELPDACRTGCLSAHCGDGVIDQLEECDDAGLNSDFLADACRSSCLAAHCGDNVVDEAEECDAGELNSDEVPDACRTSCVEAFCGDGVIDADEECDAGLLNSDEVPDACRTDCLAAHCGDGVIDEGEECDDGNLEDWDGCQADCVVYITVCGDNIKTPNEECDWGEENSDEIPDTCRTSCLMAHCGDGVMDQGEECDDGNYEGGDECGLDCKPYVAFCGNGWIDEGEECDDGPDNNDYLPDHCRKNCSNYGCGDKVVDSGEECDKGPANSDENPNACRTSCLLPFCGDGVIDISEQCDDGPGNADVPNSCKSDCQLPECGDGVVDDLYDEECDWGEENNDDLPDACRTNCKNSWCGDGSLDSDEECDDGELNSDELPNTCRTWCVPAFCGDNVVDDGEECDDGGANAQAPNSCKTNCVAPFCGDGVADDLLGEECDWAELASNIEPDFCRTNCLNPFCSDNVIDSIEECDDGNLILGDGCAPDCAIETYVPDPGDVIITEIMQNPAKVYDSLGEYFEVYNKRNFEIDISGWDISDTEGESHELSPGQPLVVPPMGFLVLGTENDLDLNGGVSVDYEYSDFLLDNGSDSIILSYKGAISDEVNYDGGPLFPDPKGASMNLKPGAFTHQANDIGANWCESTKPLPSGDTGTPGENNSECP